MTQSTVNSNSVQPNGLPDTGNSTEMGDSWNEAVTKINANFTELYTAGGGVTPGTVTPSKALVVDASSALTGMGSITFLDATTLGFSATTGTKIGGTALQKLAFYGATPTAQPSVLTAVTTTAPTLTVFGFTTTAQFNALIAAVNTLITNTKTLGLMATA